MVRYRGGLDLRKTFKDDRWTQDGVSRPLYTCETPKHRYFTLIISWVSQNVPTLLPGVYLVYQIQDQQPSWVIYHRS